MGEQELSPAAVAELRLLLGRVDDVGEEDCGKHRRDGGGRSSPARPRTMSIIASTWSPERPGEHVDRRVGHERRGVFSLFALGRGVGVSDDQRRGCMDTREDVPNVGLPGDPHDRFGDVGARSVPGDPCVASHEVLVNRERMTLIVWDPGTLRRAIERLVAGVLRSPPRSLPRRVLPRTLRLAVPTGSREPMPAARRG